MIEVTTPGSASKPLDRYGKLGRLPLADIIDLLPGTFYIIDPAGRLVLWNAGVESATGRSHEDIAAIVATDMFSPEEQAKVAGKIAEVIEHGGPVVLEAGLVSTDGRVTPFLFTGSRFIVDGAPYVCGMGLDISERRQQEEQLRLRERALHASSNGIFIVRCTELSNPIVYVNPAFERITGYRSAEILGRDSDSMCGFIGIPGMDDDEHVQVRNAINEQRETRVTFRNVRKNGDIFWNDLTVAPVANDEGAVTHFIGVINDVTESQQRNSFLEHEINHDVLTGLANRNLMWDRLEQALYLAQRSKSLVAVVLVDLDNFKTINDSWGHDAGDEVLRVAGRKMLASVRDSDTVARLGGDEFVLILTNQPSLRYTLRMIERMRRTMANPIMVEHKEIPLKSSMGVSVFPHDGVTPGELIRSADTAMYHAKMSGRDNVQFFSNDMKVATDAKVKLEERMRHAIDNGEMFLVFQPKMSVDTEKIVGAEALLRWRHPEQGVLLPAAFLLEAEENGMIVQLGQWVCSQVCQALQRLKSLGYPDLVVSMNVSFREFSHRDFIAVLSDRLQQFGIEPGRFELEVTEANLLRNTELSDAVLAQVARLGVKVSVDAFGAGLSNLRNLHQLPVTNLKLYKPYVDLLHADNEVLATTIIGLGRLMNKGVIGEGVETPQQRDFLKRHGCSQVQGNYFSHPISLPVFEQLLADTNFGRRPG